MRLLTKRRIGTFVTYVCEHLRYFLRQNNIYDGLETLLGVDTNKHNRLVEQVEIASEQIDALVDICYYILNDMTKLGDKGLIYPDTILNEWWNMVNEFTTGTHGHRVRVVNGVEIGRFFHTTDEAKFIVKMVLSEVWELCDTVTESSDESREMILEAMKNKSWIDHEPMTTILTECCKMATEMGLDIDAVFKVVHQANMDKRDPITGQFNLREDGKVLKPEGWTPPNILEEVKRQLRVTTLPNNE